MRVQLGPVSLAPAFFAAPPGWLNSLQGSFSMAMSPAYPAQLDFHAGRDIDRWRPLVQWLLAIPHLLVAYALSRLRDVLTLISFFAVLFTKRIPRPLFNSTAMTLRFVWRSIPPAFILFPYSPPFDFH